jgi:riboflavin kinase/FMN adenylyltransferase
MTIDKMLVFHDLTAAADFVDHSVVALGNFDGVHLGHQEIIKRAKASKSEAIKKAGVITFFPHPTHVLKKDKSFNYIHSLQERLKKLESLGLDFTLVIDFTQEFASMKAEEFIEQILRDQLRVAKVLTGSNFGFGYRRQGTPALLKEYAKKGAFAYEMIEKINHNDIDISSSTIKKLLSQGRVIKANALLQQPYSLFGQVIKGSGQASKLLALATANIAVNGEKVLPMFGVYLVRIAHRESKIFGIANLGLRPTVGGETPMLEVHLFDFNQDLYGEELTVEFLILIRPEYKFARLENLKTQIAMDIKSSRYLAKNLDNWNECPLVDLK